MCVHTEAVFPRKKLLLIRWERHTSGDQPKQHSRLWVQFNACVLFPIQKICRQNFLTYPPIELQWRDWHGAAANNSQIKTHPTTSLLKAVLKCWMRSSSIWNVQSQENGQCERPFVSRKQPCLNPPGQVTESVPEVLLWADPELWPPCRWKQGSGELPYRD